MRWLTTLLSLSLILTLLSVEASPALAQGANEVTDAITTVADEFEIGGDTTDSVDFLVTDHHLDRGRSGHRSCR